MKADAQPTLAVVIPCLNEVGRIGGLVASLLAEVDELIVVDGGSSDGSAARAAEAGARVILAPRGRGRQLHVGALAARSRILWFLHADSVAPPAAAATLRAAGDPERWGCFEVAIDSADPRLRLTAAWMNRRAHRSGWCTGDMGIWVGAALYCQLGGFPVEEGLEDMAFCQRALGVRGPLVLPAPLGLSARRWQERGIGSTILRLWALRLGFHLGLPPALLAGGHPPLPIRPGRP